MYLLKIFLSGMLHASLSTLAIGMSVKIANISGEKWYIGGAPRSKYYGQVLLFRQVGDYLHVEPQHILTGKQIGEGFGYDIEVADLNGDG